ncbi:MAG: methyltransferase, partial [Chloroflexia bacterium]
RSAQRILDVGTGTGVLAITAARAGANSVVATDVNPSAVACARANVRQHGLDSRIVVEQADFAPRSPGAHFDLVICNPPYFKGVPRNHAQLAYMGGANLEWFDRFTYSVRPHLTLHGRALLVLSDAADLPAIMERLSAGGWAYRVVARRDITIEVMYIVELVPRNL